MPTTATNSVNNSHELRVCIIETGRTVVRAASSKLVGRHAKLYISSFYRNKEAKQISVY